MVERRPNRRQAAGRAAGGGNYFSQPKTDVNFIASGCLTLDLALGGGWAEDRIANVVGDKSSGKTLLAIEMAANFAQKYPKGKIRYREAEAAFMPAYAEALGMPAHRVDFGEALDTVEDMFEDLQKVIAGARHPELYIVDSLDALSDRAEMERDMDEGTYGAAKAKNLSQLFRRTVRGMERAHVTCLIISQVRSKIGISFGRTTTRSGGRALDFYASQVLYLSTAALETKTVRGEKRPIGVNVRGRVDKNKIGLPFREAAFQIMFGYGVDSVGASLDWLKSIKALDDIGLSNKTKDEDLREIKKQYLSTGVPDIPVADVEAAVRRRWYEIEERFLPTRRKY
jgi:recombination protein RecA